VFKQKTLTHWGESRSHAVPPRLTISCCCGHLLGPVTGPTVLHTRWITFPDHARGGFSLGSCLRRLSATGLLSLLALSRLLVPVNAFCSQVGGIGLEPTATELTARSHSIIQCGGRKIKRRRPSRLPFFSLWTYPVQANQPLWLRLG